MFAHAIDSIKTVSSSALTFLNCLRIKVFITRKKATSNNNWSFFYVLLERAGLQHVCFSSTVSKGRPCTRGKYAGTLSLVLPVPSRHPFNATLVYYTCVFVQARLV